MKTHTCQMPRCPIAATVQLGDQAGNTHWLCIHHAMQDLDGTGYCIVRRLPDPSCELLSVADEAKLRTWPTLAEKLEEARLLRVVVQS